LSRDERHLKWQLHEYVKSLEREMTSDPSDATGKRLFAIPRFIDTSFAVGEGVYGG
ncbi:hypothetical protein A2U01_0097934, partial [Trifolium medium]|nr:hypothetical protein [Trifolium medium]